MTRVLPPELPLQSDSANVRRVRLEHATAGAASDRIEFLATIDLEMGLAIGPVRIVLAEPTRVAIDWPDRLLGSDGAGAAREVHLSPRARQQIHDALVRHLVFGDLGSERP